MLAHRAIGEGLKTGFLAGSARYQALPGNADPEALPPFISQLTGERSVGCAEVIKFLSLKTGFLAIAINSFM